MADKNTTNRPKRRAQQITQTSDVGATEKAFSLLLEDGSHLLLNDGSRIALEQQNG